MSKGEHILDAAYRVFGDKGYHTARMDDIAKAAGVAKGTLYLYFRNKEVMFQAMLTKILDDYLAVHEQIARSERPFGEKLAALLKHHLLFIRDRHNFVKAHMNEVLAIDALQEKWRNSVERERALFVRCLVEEYPFLNERDAYLCFLSFCGMSDGMVYDLCWLDDGLTDSMVEERARFAANLLISGLEQLRTEDMSLRQVQAERL
ncbi:TetR/AcrR family transcriptional regulator [Numidum massiliense]|uniref:TetR/AcrR family transcriptional regulator n=1 Tax=Numidum massiliense TaxID=1522315 RepID=UPI0006D52FBE|nr:TetR/AcrR family transcriptional regulator [Numidum massiliense]